MNTFLKAFGLPVLLTGAMSLMLPSPAQASDDDLDCEKIRARSVSSVIVCPAGTPFEGQPLCTTGNIRGDLRGTFLFAVHDLAPSAGMPATLPPNILSIVAEGTITTKGGTLTLSDNTIVDFDPDGDGAFGTFMRVIDGTGEFAEATGTLFLHGGFTADKTGFRSEWQGEICVPDND